MQKSSSCQTPIIVILGPTASGKSELAVKMAKKLNGEIISADSRQVYKGLDIGSGKIKIDSVIPVKTGIQKKRSLDSHFRGNDNNLAILYKGTRHHLLDVASPKRVFTVAQYQKLAKKAMTDIVKRGKTPIICGGTGLYIDALLYDWQLPQVPPNMKLRKRLEKKSVTELFKQLQKLDPARAKNIDKNNPRRLIRALEIIHATGKPIAPLKQNIICVNPLNNPCKSATAPAVLKIGLNPPENELKKRISVRIKKMFRDGLLEEIKKLRKDLSWQKIESFGFEYKYPAMFLQNKINRDEMIAKMLVENWHYAKRQMTWFKRDKTIKWTLKNQKLKIKV